MCPDQDEVDEVNDESSKLTQQRKEAELVLDVDVGSSIEYVDVRSSDIIEKYEDVDVGSSVVCVEYVEPVKHIKPKRA